MSAWKVPRMMRWSIEGCARDLYRELIRRDRKSVVVDFERSTEDVVLIFARGDRAKDYRAFAATLSAKHGGEIEDVRKAKA